MLTTTRTNLLLPLVATIALITKSHSYTFNNPGKSLVSYEVKLDLSTLPVLGDTHVDTDPDYYIDSPLQGAGRTDSLHINVTIQVRYRTWQGNTVLLTGSLVPRGRIEDDTNEDTGLILQLKVLIKDGWSLCVYVDDDGEEDRLVTPPPQQQQPVANESVWWWYVDSEGDKAYSQHICLEMQEGVNDNEWHTAILEIGERTLGILSSEMSEGQTLNILPITYGHLDFKLDLPGRVARQAWFVGCMDLVSVSSDKQERDISSYLTTTQDVVEGCVDQCISDNPCSNSGVCIDMYNSVLCDCYGTGFVGTHCQDLDAAEVSLQGKEWLTLNLLNLPDTDLVYSVRHRVALQFRTVAKEGILYYTKEEYPVYNHVALSLRAGSLHVSVVFADQDRFNEVYTAMGTGLDDSRWHSVSVTLYKTEVLVSLDGETEKMQGSGHHGRFFIPRVAVFGGMQMAALTTQGLKSTHNLVGCLKEVYYNYVSVVDKLDQPGDIVMYSGGDAITSCIDPADSSVQFPRDGSFVTLNQPKVDKLVLTLEFKTLKANCLLVQSDVSTVVGGGLMQVSLQGGQLEVRVVISAPQPTPVKTIKIGDNLSDNNWHLLDIYYSNGRMDVRIDDKNELTSLDLALQFSSKLYLGFSPIINIRRGFAGCMKSITLNNQIVNPVDILHSPTSIGITLGTCDLADMCQGHIKEEFQCQNKGMCVSEWSDIYCDCENVFFEGRYCQFGKLQRSCAGLYESGVSESAVYYISPSGTPVTVYCDMGQYLQGGVHSDGSTDVQTGVTRVDHNLRAQTQIRGKGLTDLKKVITYRSMDNPALRRLIKSSAYCEQTLTFTCSQSPLFFGLDTWMVSPETKKVVPVVRESELNCDKAKAVLVKDSVTIRDPAQLPITEIYAYRAWGNASVILTPLYCYGAESQLDGYSVTFVTSSSYLILPWVWQGGVLRFEFKTVQSEALLLTQVHDSGNTLHKELRVSLRNGQEVEVYVPHTDSPYLAVTDYWLNDSTWHAVEIETSGGEVRLIIDKQTFFIQLATREPVPTDSSTQLYLGGMPQDATSVYHLPGFTGCMRSISVEDQLYQPSKYLDTSTDILQGCQSHCNSSPCQNGGHCVEKWTHYFCQCANPLAQSGINCQIDINTDPVSIEEGHVQFELPKSLLLGSLRIIFSFQTRERQVQILRVSLQDRLLLSVDIQNGTFITATLYSEKKTSVQIWMLGLCKGVWTQALIEVNNRLLQMVVDDKSQVATITGDLSGSRGDLRLVTGSGYKGCLRGFQVNGKSFSLLQAIYGNQGQSPGCSNGCTDISTLCTNNGQCVVDTTTPQSDPFCDCSLTGYAGHYCDRDVGGYFTGETVLVQWLQPFPDVASEFLKVLLYFSTDVRNRRKMPLLKLQADSDSSEHTLVYLSEECTLVAEITIQGQTVHLESSLSMCDGQPHHVILTRLHRDITLLVDDETVKQALPGPLQVTTAPSLLVVGSSQVPSVISEEWPVLYNFTGNIANVFVVCDQLVVSARPLDIASGFSQSDLERVTVYGELQPATQSLVNHRKPQRSRTSDPRRGLLPASSVSGMSGTLAPVEPKEADTVDLTTKAAASEDEGGMYHPALVFGICILVLVILAIIVVIFVVRHYRKKTKRWAPEDSKKDEEEGLLTDSPLSSPTKDQTPGDNKDSKVPEVTFRHGPKQPGSGDKKKSQIPQEDDDEATPMLLSMQPHLPDDHVELNNFQKQINKLPMIDDTIDESSLENEPAVPLSPHKDQTKPDQEDIPAEPKGGGAVTGQSGDLPVNGEHTSPLEDNANEKPKETPLIPDVNGLAEDPNDLPVNGRNTPPHPAKVKMRQPPGVTSDRLALTESQVLDMLDTNLDDGEIPVPPDPKADTSFSSLPDESPQCVDLEIQADVHHRTMSFDSETAPDTPDPLMHSKDLPGIANGYNTDPEVAGMNGETTHCSNRSLTRIPEENCNPEKDSSNGEAVVPNGQHSNNLLNSQSRDSMKVNGPSYVIDNSLNEIHVDNSR